MLRFAKPLLKRTLSRMRAGRGAGRAVVLCYHSIHPHRPFRSASPVEFARQLAWLSENCDLVDFADIQAKNASERPRVAITFDDGYDDNLHYAAPLLERWQAPATFFLTAGFVEREPTVLAKFARERHVPVIDVPPLSWAQVRALKRRGFSVGAHTYGHRCLATLDDGDVFAELSRSKRLIEERIEERVTAMSYPYGKPARHFTPRIMDMARDLGYSRAAAVLFRALRDDDSPLAIPRFYVGADDVEQLQAKVMGQWDYLGWWQERSPRWAARLVSPEDFSEEFVRA